MNTLPCPKCGFDQSGVIDSRTGQGKSSGFIRRRRVCRLCGHRFSTHETVVAKPVPAPTVELDVTGMSLPEIGNALYFNQTRLVGLSAHGRRHVVAPEKCVAVGDAFFFAHFLTLQKLKQQTSVPIKQ